MEIKDFEKVTSDILTNLTDQGKVSEYLTKLNEAYQTTYTTSQSFETKQTDYENEIKALKETNMNLFLKIKNPPENTSAANTDPEPLTYEKLVTEMDVK